MVELLALGTAQIRTNCATVTPTQEVAFAAALYLIVERGKPLTRAKVKSLLWPDIEPSVRSHRLRQTIYQLKALGLTVRSNREALTLPREGVRSDIDDLSSTAEWGSEQTRNLEFLPGYHPQHSGAFEAWLDGVRENVHAALTRALIGDLRDARNACRWLDVERIAGQCLQLDPYNEAAVLARAEAYAMRGQKAAALSILNRFVEDVSPNERALVLPATVLRRRILQSDDVALAKPVGSTDPEFVGRTEEMRTLSQLLQRAGNAGGGGCLITGEPGIGKTRLCLELAKFAELQGFQVERVSCKRSDIDQPLSAFVTLVPKLRELRGALGCSRETLAWLTRLTEFTSFPNEVRPSAEDSSAIYMHLRTAVFDLLDAISDESNVLVVVEDVQWLDRTSTKLFGAIVDWAASKRLFLLFNARDDVQVLCEAVTTTGLPVIPLLPLAADDAVRLARTFADEASELLHEPSVTWFINAAEGNPYFLQELIKHRIESGRRHSIPPSVASVLNDRLSRLSEAARQLLQACAVLNENSDLERLEQVLEFAPHDLLGGIQELSASGMVRTPASGAHVTSLFVRHDLLSNHVLGILAPTSLAYLHRRCALVLQGEALGPSTSVSLLRACAFHWYQAGEAEKAHDLALKCADHLLEVGLAVDAATGFESALSFCGSQAKQLEVLNRIVHAHRMANDRTGILDTIGRIRAVQGRDAASFHDDLEILEFESLRITATPLTELFERTLTCVFDHTLPASHRVAAAAEAAKLATGLPNLPALERIYETVKPLLTDDTVPTRTRLQLQVIYNTMCGDLRQALVFAKQRLEYERQEGTISSLINSMTDLSFVIRRTGPAQEALDVLRRAYTIAEKHKHYGAARDCAERVATMLEDDGRQGYAEWKRLAAACKGAASVGHTPFSSHFDSVRIALRDNRLEDARRELDNEFDWNWLSERRIWLAAGTGLQIRLLVAERAPAGEVQLHVNRMLELYKVTAVLGMQDYEIGGLVTGLRYLGERQAVKEYLDDYILRKRRDLTPLSRELAEIGAEYGQAGTRAASISRPDASGKDDSVPYLSAAVS